MATFKLQAENIRFGYWARPHYVAAETAHGAIIQSPFHNREGWVIHVNNKGDRMPRFRNHAPAVGARSKRRAVRAAAGITTTSRPVRRKMARLASKLKSYAEDSSNMASRTKPGSAKCW